jgi:anti-sigma B factor antagonist
VATAQFDIVTSGPRWAPVLEVRGELDIATAPELTRAVRAVFDQGTPRLIIDLTNCTFIDSSGMSKLVQAHLTGKALGTKITIRGAIGNARRALEVCGLITLLEQQ